MAELVDAQQETLVDFKTVRFSSVLGIVQNAGSSPANSTLILKNYGNKKT